MAVTTWLLYVMAVMVLTAAPGPSSLLCITKSVVGGFKIGAYAALGSLTAITIIMSLSFTGLGVMVASSALVFSMIKWLGAGYLIYLGIKALRSTQTTYALDNGLTETVGTANQPKRSATSKHFINGFMVGASNPKAIVFFTALFPQFIDPTRNMLTQYLAFVSTFITLELSWLLFYTYMGAKSSTWMMQPGRATLFNRLTGGVFIGAGIFLSTTHRS